MIIKIIPKPLTNISHKLDTKHNRNISTHNVLFVLLRKTVATLSKDKWFIPCINAHWKFKHVNKYQTEYHNYLLHSLKEKISALH